MHFTLTFWATTFLFASIAASPCIGQTLQDRVNATRKAGVKKEIILPAGRYELDKPLRLNAKDSGLVIAGEDGAEVELVGSIPLKDWAPVADQPELWEAKLPATFTPKVIRRLYLHGTRLKRARHPNTGWLESKETLATKPPLTLGVPDNLVREDWPKQGVVIRGIQKWAGFQLAVMDVDLEDQRVTLTGQAIGHRQEKTNRFWIENSIEAIDEPGEWCFDPSTQMVRLLPPDDVDLTTAVITVPSVRSLVEIEGATDITLRNIMFSECDVPFPPEGDIDTQAAAPRRGAVVLRSSRKCTIEDCSVWNVDGYAIDIARGSQDCVVRGCEMADLGAGGVRIGETNPETSPESVVSGNIVEDCRIHDYGQLDFGACGVIVFQASKNQIRHNEIYDAPYTGVSVGWTWGYRESPCRGNIIEKNHIHNLGGAKLLSDLGGVYLLGPQPGTVVRNNLIHDLSCFDYGGWGLYTDEGSSGILLEGNVIMRCQSAGFHQHYGRDNVVRGNVFVDCGEGGVRRSKDENHVSFKFEKNIVVNQMPTFLTGNWKYGKSPFSGNLYFATEDGEKTWAGKTWKSWQSSGQDTTSQMADPQWLDPQHPEEGVAETSPALKLGITVPTLTSIGPRE